MSIKRVTLAALVLCLLINLTGCAQETPPPEYGHYKGEKSNWGTSFDVTSAGIARFGLYFESKRSNSNVTISETCGTGILPTAPINADGTFTLTDPKKYNTTITGKISGDKVSGEYTTNACGETLHGKWSAAYDQPLSFDADHAVSALLALGFTLEPGTKPGDPVQEYVYGTDNGALSESFMTVKIYDFGSVDFSQWTAVYLKNDNRELFKSAVSQVYSPALADWADSTIAGILAPTGKAVNEIRKTTIDGNDVILGVGLQVGIMVSPPDY